MEHGQVVRRVDLPAHGVSTGEARRFVVRTLRELGLDGLEDSAVLAVSELVTNAVLHARTPIDLTLRASDGSVRIEVGDASPVVPALREYDELATTGRGLGLVSALVDDLGVEPRDTGKTVWFTLPRADDVDGPHGDLLDLWGLDEPAPVAGRSALLLGLPVGLWEASQQHHDAVLRELVLHRGSRLPGTLQAWAWYAAADSGHAALSAAVDRALAGAEGEPALLDVPVPLEDGLPARLDALRTALDDADALAAEGLLLVDPAPPAAVALRAWTLAEVTGQAAGRPPSPWSG